MSYITYKVQNVKNKLYWSNETGWGDFEHSTTFHPDEVNLLDLPVDGKWVGTMEALELVAKASFNAAGKLEKEEPFPSTRLRCPSCGIPTIEDKQEDITEEERLCARCSIDGEAKETE